MGKTRIENRIRRLRFDRDEMTQQALAEKVGVTRQTINAIELGKYSPSLEVAFLIARALGVALEEAFSYPEEGEVRTDVEARTNAKAATDPDAATNAKVASDPDAATDAKATTKLEAPTDVEAPTNAKSRTRQPR